jgi:hypothetical protein
VIAPKPKEHAYQKYHYPAIAQPGLKVQGAGAKIPSLEASFIGLIGLIGSIGSVK